MIINTLAIKAPHLVAEWDEVKNKLSADQISYSSDKKFWWKCGYGHKWQATVKNRYRGTGCPDCSKEKRCLEYNFVIRYPDLIKEWHPEKNHPLTPNDVTRKNSKKIWWRCEKNHVWQGSVRSRIKGTGCSVCMGREGSPEYNFGLSYPHLIPEWDNEKNAPLTPYIITPKSSKKIWWKCQKRHSWQATAYTRSKGHNCPKCNIRSSRLEIKIYCELQFIFHNVKWQEKLFGREVDIYLPEYQLAVEIDGWYWHKNSAREISDKKKNQILIQNGIKLIRLVDGRLEYTGENIIHFKNGEDTLRIIHRLLFFLLDKENFSEYIFNRIKTYINGKEYFNQVGYKKIVSQLPFSLIKKSVADFPDLLKEWSFKKKHYRSFAHILWFKGKSMVGMF